MSTSNFQWRWELNVSRYQKGVYFPSTADKEKISVGAERQRRYRVIRKLRSEPTDLADMTGILAPNLARLESRKRVPTLVVLQKYASALGMHIEVKLCDGTEEEEKKS